MLELTWADCFARATRIVDCLGRHSLLYGVPNGGIPAAIMVGAIGSWNLTEDPTKADVIIDDLIDSGKTRERFAHVYGRPFHVLVDKQQEDIKEWVSFPWERMSRDAPSKSDDGIEDNVRRMLQYIGEDPERDGLKETPRRVARAYDDLFGGYKENVSDVLTTFDREGVGTIDEMIILKNVSFTSCCEHHMLPFSGVAHIAYIPSQSGRLVGISKLARILDIYARRLQLQERLCDEITSAIDEHLAPLGSGCVIEARHSCMSCRGVRKQGSSMVTSSLKGVFRQPEVRAEFFHLVAQ